MGVMLAWLLLAAQQTTQEPTATPMSPAEEGTFHFAHRADGANGDTADPREVDAAILAYRKAVEASPNDLDLLARLLRALHFRGAYAGASVEEKKGIFEEGRKLGQDAVDRVENLVGRMKPAARIEALQKIRGIPALYLWTATHWGELGLVRGKLSAARSGIAAKVRDLAQTIVDVDPNFGDAAGYRILGRLHAEAPKVIFITGWVSHEKGVEYLRKSYELAPNMPVTWFFLGDAILAHEPEHTTEAVALLEKCANASPRPGFVIEDMHFAQSARDRLAEMKNGY